MKVTLDNGTELNPILVSGGQRHVQGADRDSLSFIFPATEDILTLDAVFNPANCEHITIEDDDGGVYIHSGYTVRAELSKTSVEVEQENPNAPAVYEERITVAMTQRTYSENQMQELRDALDLLLSGATGEEDATDEG